MQACPICQQSAEFWCQARDHHYGNPGIWDAYRCPHCRHIFQYPVPTEEDLLQFYPTTYYAHQPAVTDFTPRGLRHRGVWLKLHYLKYFRGYNHLRVSANPILACLAFFLNHKPLHIHEPVFQPGGILLDYGAGSGDQVAFAQYVGWQAEGIEINLYAAKAGSDAGINVHHGSIDILEGRTNRYNYIMSSHCIEHVPDVWRLFQAFFKALKPGGILAIDVPNADSTAAERFTKFYYYLGMPVHVHLFSPHSIGLLCQMTGFIDLRMATYSLWHTEVESTILIDRLQKGKPDQVGFHSHSKWQGFFGSLKSLPIYIRSRIQHRGDCLVMTCMKPPS
jgi:SAM-dependent methyltransferase